MVTGFVCQVIECRAGRVRFRMGGRVDGEAGRMAKVKSMNSIAKSKSKEESASLVAQFLSALLTFGMIKPSQGRVVRQVTFFSLATLFALLAWEIGKHTPTAAYHYTVFGVLTLIGAWVSYRIINMPTFADFLIGTEAEMRKVTWPTKPELLRGSVVVMVVILGLAAAMFLFDFVWALLFRAIGLR